ncbi:glycosyltransferase family 39 protein [Polyangium sp. y55x31]|uniref:glycosyltransferase family 39 protein n=1 Tax=Polyangium sp. y55x31 TaxID=3042688 RepID=UPI0024821205|nr:glycosyltransferase family 39 protein [Polyangium sp. y55x31]MDI1476845.1 glycosyltransferase family 39 protein [Polyangium sp. y55x31]
MTLRPLRRPFLAAVTLLALALRLVWNLVVHPPSEHVYSDMAGYFERSTALLDAPLGKNPADAFFPYGTHVLIALVRAVFGRENHAAPAVLYALVGASLVPLVSLLAERLGRGRIAPRIAALVACFYYPWISLGGYFLSELPFTVCVTAAALFSLRLADTGRARDAFLFGASVALGATFRPQILLSLPLLFLVWLARRRALPRIRPAHIARALVPVVLVLAVSAARFHHHMGRFGLISANGPLNYAFGRCHAVDIEARTRGYYASFGPPPMGYLAYRDKKYPDAFVRLDPAFGTRLTVQGTMWNAGPFYSLAEKCVAKTGLVRQARYALGHVVMLWGYNIVWPDSGTDDYRRPMRRALDLHNVLLLPPMLVAFAASRRRDLARHALLSAHLVALVLMAIVYFGDVRYRVPYDGIVIALAFDGYARVVGWVRSVLPRTIRV